MMTSTAEGVEITCDFCLRAPEWYPGEFRQAWDRAKADGWRARKDADSDAWVHSCPDCTREGRR
ncbi:MAG: hypothetical protein PHU85_18820 [Phycisphaerae bacterium]|nr:hypothetical protein [Phycisphaerae bacterium]